MARSRVRLCSTLAAGALMNVGVLLPHIAARPAGVGRYADAVCRRLVAPTTTLTPIAQAVEVRPSWSTVSDWVSIPGGNLPGPARRARRLQWLASTQTGKMLGSQGIDIVYAVAQEGLLARHGPPVCLVVHDLIPLDAPKGRRLDAVQLRTVFPRMLSNAAGIIAVSEATKQAICDRFGVRTDRVTVIPSGVDHEVFRPVCTDAVKAAQSRHGVGPETLIHLGTLAPHKDADLLVRALGVSPLRSSDARVAFIGPIAASDRARIERLARQVGVSSRLVWPGYVDLQDLVALLTGAASVVQLSRVEGFGLAVLEAMACGAPVLASDAAALRETVADGGTIVASRDAGEVAEQITAHLSAPRAEHSAPAIARAAKFDWTWTAAATHTALTRIQHDFHDGAWGD
ncbi:MAG: glycosyltransferase family 4 protein [Planctomycetota bacterium]